MSSLKALGLATAIGLFPACEKPAEKPEPPKQETVSACERLRAAVAMEVLTEQMASDPAAWKLFPAPVAGAAWKDFHKEGMAAATELKTAESQYKCLQEIKEGK